MSRQSLILRDSHGISVRQTGLNGFDLSYCPDDGRFYVCDRNEYGDLETRATFAGTEKGFHNARHFMRTKAPR